LTKRSAEERWWCNEAIDMVEHVLLLVLRCPISHKHGFDR
jgi:hypothetical protein